MEMGSLLVGIVKTHGGNVWDVWKAEEGHQPQLLCPGRIMFVLGSKTSGEPKVW